ncbi:MAG: tetratricopeptide repeat protein [bacterium]|jgi:tetratricopeptide (TPR) repeat protein|nr:tetratricopeptide repeat protein [candidate division KSB1 bacterium]MDH7559086.1 tetratricopeptide repeat protein [bacterium]
MTAFMLKQSPGRAVLICLVCVVALATCSKETPTAPKKGPVTWIAEGWRYFEAKDFAEAVNCFSTALNMNPSDSIAAIAHCGLGWSQARQRAYEVAHNNFTFSVQKDSTTPGPYVADSYAGRAATFFRMNLYSEAISDVKKALSSTGTYEFVHDRTVRFTDLHFLMAEAYYHTRQYQMAQEKVDFLRALFALPPINWTVVPYMVDGLGYGTYQEALLKAIEGLRSRV